MRRAAVQLGSLALAGMALAGCGGDESVFKPAPAESSAAPTEEGSPSSAPTDETTPSADPGAVPDYGTAEGDPEWCGDVVAYVYSAYVAGSPETPAEFLREADTARAAASDADLPVGLKVSLETVAAYYDAYAADPAANEAGTESAQTFRAAYQNVAEQLDASCRATAELYGTD